MGGRATILFFCGKMGAGKSTRAREFACQNDAILFSEDEWLATIYPDEIKNLSDYVIYSSRLKPLLKKHVQGILNAGVSVVMDFPGNNKNQGAWFKEIFSEHNVAHKLFYLESSDEHCLKQLEQRRKSHPERSHFDTEEVFHQVTAYFQPPSDEEGFTIEVLSTKRD